MKVVKAILIYLFIMSERVFLIPFSAIRPSTMMGVLTNEFEAKKLIQRNCIGWGLILAYLFPWWVGGIVGISIIIILISKFKNKKQ